MRGAFGDLGAVGALMRCRIARPPKESEMPEPDDDPRSGTSGAIPAGTDMGTGSRDHHPPANRAGVSGASGSGAAGESVSTGGASGSGPIGALPEEADRGPASGGDESAHRGGASGSDMIDDLPVGASGSSEADDNDSGA